MRFVHWWNVSLLFFCEIALIVIPVTAAPPSAILCPLFPSLPDCETQADWSFRSSSRIPSNCPPFLTPSPLPNGVHPPEWADAFAKWQEVLDSRINPISIPAYYSTIVYRDEIVWQHGEGVRDKKENPTQPPTIDNIFRIASISKVWPALLLFRAYELGYIDSIDDPVDKYVPRMTVLDRFAPAPGQRRSITWHQLASNGAGLPRTSPCMFGTGCNITLEQAIDRVREYYWIFPGDTRSSYSNLGFSLLGNMLSETFWNASFESVIDQLIHQPLGMVSTGLRITEEVKAKMAVGYVRGGVEAVLYPLGFEDPAGGVYSSSRDLVSLVLELLRAEERFAPQPSVSKVFGKRDTLRRLMQPTLMIPTGMEGFGTPFELFQRPQGYLFRTKAGNLDGYSSIIFAVPELQLGGTIAYTGSVDMFTLIDEAIDAFFDAFLAGLKTIQPTATPSPNPSLYVGTYESIDGVQLLVRTNDEGVLYLAAPGAIPYPMSYTNVHGMYAIPDVITQDIPIPCLAIAAIAQFGQYVIFEETNGRVTRFSIPGLSYDYFFNRV